MPLKRDSLYGRSPGKISFFTDTLLRWFYRNGRKFPWRRESDPFRILIAEIMLQRTKAHQVAPVYIEFIKRFPTIKSLRCAKRNEINMFILRLGLHWRTKMIAKMVQEINSKYDGLIPSERQELLTIPGVGDYISDAVTVFGFGGRRTVIDSNVIRLVSRFFGVPIQGEVRRNKDFVRFCQTLVNKLPSNRIKDFNWALIDLPALICIRNPRCQICPLSSKCNYFAKNLKVR